MKVPTAELIVYLTNEAILTVFDAKLRTVTSVTLPGRATLRSTMHGARLVAAALGMERVGRTRMWRRYKRAP